MQSLWCNPQQLLHPRVHDLKFDSLLGLFSSFNNGEPFKQNISMAMKKRFVFFRASSMTESANHNGEQEAKKL
ncbi:hypothetical protein SADUNF_Sadunf16G0298300 [Salix dunnii]|uniref:Uncharacterized protein n=1 Tax=Salix dunnii TaxID=1413687 RepID=A0A835JH72_9ROSI|nr:hypothetical protein SADUNF_Sadunf16G0298300 [Salix dunnii]